MALELKTINNVQYYYENGNYYTFHIVSNPRDGLFLFAAQDLGIRKTSGFTPQESTLINDLAGGINQRTKYLLLKNGQAVPMPYNATVPAIIQGSVILRKVEASSVPGLVRHSCASYSLPGPVCSVCGKPFP